ncbi:response regulator [Panacibacter ginsenosidivorans]|uniref:Response regulator n=1 Tax=Panacibacter ginsenosidivorans TaxID=1813871 RepID=A0A5B8VC76_9BACT|nr:response regulator [Panacibacter ginsenosidivorans]QEC67878.1 response regulator [Panacibacter ginsenosidivorans]
MKNGMRKTVYLIDDDSDILSVLAVTLQYGKFEPIMDFNGNNFDVTRRPCPDLYIIDINLLGKNGCDLCGQIKGACPDIPVILLSANMDIEQLSLACNADAFISKPFDILNVLDTVNKLMYSERRTVNN